MKTKTILIVDDEVHMRRLIRFNLEKKLSTSILEATSGEETIALIKEHKINLLIIDFFMPGVNGVITIQKIRQIPHYENLPVIMLTARGQMEVKQECEQLKISAFFTKPFSPAALVAEVNQLLKEAS